MALPAALLACLLGAASAQDWAPPRPPPVQPALLRPPGARELSPAAVGQYLDRTKGADPEAARAAAWASGRESLWLAKGPHGWALGSRGEAIAVSEALATAIRRTDAYFGLAPASLAHPVTHEELAAALLSPEGVARVRAIFDSMLDRRLWLEAKPIFLERGGEATLDRTLELKEWADPTRDAMPRLAAAIDDDAEIIRLYETDEGVKALDESGLLKNLVRLLGTMKQRGDPPEKLAKVRRLTVRTIIENGGDAFVFDPQAQLDAIAANDWSGRFVGRWHTHPPHFTDKGWDESEPNGPSHPDMEIASSSGQNLTIAFRADGFDAWDLMALEGKAPDLTLARPIRYRSPEWKRRFAERHAEVARGRPGP